MRIWVGACVLLLAGCAGHAPPIREVMVPIAAPCITKIIPEPPESYADDGLAQVKDPAERMKRVGAANQQRRSRLAILEPAVKACR